MERGSKYIMDDIFFSGYLPVDEKGQDMFYAMFESRSGSKDSDPLLIWLRGEAGCSVTHSLIDNMSPFTYARDADSHDPADIISNPLSWNNFTNMLFIDQPVGTGYSYPRHDKDKKRVKSIDYAVKDFVHFMKSFYQHHEKFKGRDVYLAAQDFTGGMYLPVFVKALEDVSNEVYDDEIFDEKFGSKNWTEYISFKGMVMIDPIIELGTQRSFAPRYAFNEEMMSEVYYFVLDKMSLLCQ